MVTFRRRVVCIAATAAAFTHLAGAQQSAPADPLANVGKSPAQSLGMYVFGKKSQTAATQQSEETKCFHSAKNASGYDQSMANAAAQGQPTPQTGGRVRGAVGGALLGTAVGAIAGNAGKGAAIGGTVGVVNGGARQRAANAQKANDASVAQQQSKADALAEMKRAFQACMEAHDYSVK